MRTPKFTKKNSLDAHTGFFENGWEIPRRSMKILHVAGTNGKGSVCSFLASMLKAAGKRTGLFTSPHLVKINERFVVARKRIGERRRVSGGLSYSHGLREGDERRRLSPSHLF